MKTIEERAELNLQYEKDFCGYNVSDNMVKRAYLKGATEQKAIDEKEYTEEMRKLNEEWKENLEIQRKMLIDKACEYFADWMRRHNDYAQFAVDGLRKAMEE